MRKSFVGLITRLSVFAAVLVSSALLASTAQAQMAPFTLPYSVAPSSLSITTPSVMDESELMQELTDSPHSINYMKFHTSGHIVQVTKDHQDYVVTVDDSTKPELRRLALANKVPFSTEEGGTGFMPSFGTILELLFFGMMIFMVLRMVMQANGGARMMGVGQSKAKRADLMAKKIKFKDVAGHEEAKVELYEFVDFLKNAERYKRMGAKIPKGALMIGPPGTGKTMLARAIAGEANVPFFSLSGSEFVEMFVGVGAARVRDLAEQARKFPAAIIFIDELDAIGKRRNSAAGRQGGHDEREQTLNQLLVEMDGSDQSTTIIWLAATNEPDVLDPALIRPGRFTRKVKIGRPDRADREKLFTLALSDETKPVSKEVFELIPHFARMTPGLVGADIVNSVNEAAILAARRAQKPGEQILVPDLDEGILKSTMGERRDSLSRIWSADFKRNLAVHEAGHTIVAVGVGQEPGRVTIMPRGDSGGHFQPLSELDEGMSTKEQLTNRITMSLAGKVAQEIFLTRYDTGCSSDLRVANETALYMVTKVGMSRLGSIFVKDTDTLELSNPVLAQRVQVEVEYIVSQCEAKAREIILTNKSRLLALVEALLEQETIHGPEIMALWNSLEPEQTPEPEAIPEPVVATPVLTLEPVRRRQQKGRFWGAAAAFYRAWKSSDKQETMNPVG